MRTWLVRIGIAIVVLAVAVGVAIWADSGTPNSTAGVSIVAGNTARVPVGEDFVLTHATYCGKGCIVTHVWHITYDGQNTVNFDEDGFLWFSGDHHSGRLCGIGCTTNVSMDSLDDMEISLRSDGAVNVRWPWGWDYRSYQL